MVVYKLWLYTKFFVCVYQKCNNNFCTQICCKLVVCDKDNCIIEYHCSMSIITWLYWIFKTIALKIFLICMNVLEFFFKNKVYGMLINLNLPKCFQNVKFKEWMFKDYIIIIFLWYDFNETIVILYGVHVWKRVMYSYTPIHQYLLGNFCLTRKKVSISAFFNKIQNDVYVGPCFVTPFKCNLR